MDLVPQTEKLSIDDPAPLIDRAIRLLRSKGVAEEDASDIAQEAMTRLLASDQRRLTDTLLLRSYFVFAKNVRYEYLRAQSGSRGGAVDLTHLPDERTRFSSIKDGERREHQREMLYGAIERLGANCKGLFAMRLDGLSHAEIAKRLGEPVNRLQVRFHRCVQSIRGFLGIEFAEGRV
ncbi:MAG TPA: sigma-70 family RNA polymerase sigma factor [Bryobacteraceae bacterium]|jgi:RNA polymerase sigma factor (sigma-70 family)|nr:sigma-70 family RNA polymerase sigma factor [Bryobacteraceae bacterium]